MAIVTAIGLGARHVSIIYGRVRLYIGDGLAVCKGNQHLVVVCSINRCPVNLQIRRGIGRPAVGIVCVRNFRDAKFRFRLCRNFNRMLLEPLVPEALGNLHFRHLDSRHFDAGHLDSGRDGVCGECNHAGNQADCHDGHNNFFHVVTSISFVHFLPIKADSDLNYLLILQNHRVRCSCHPRIILKPLIQAMH